MARQVEAGTWRGATIRTARKEGRCDYWLGSNNGGRCPEIIRPGDTYFDGELNERAGGFGRDRYCMDHAVDGTDAR